jgi:hypothetical protein
MKLVLALVVALLPWAAGAMSAGGNEARPAAVSTPPPGLMDAPAAAPGTLRPLPFLHDFYTFRGTAGTAVVVAYAIEAGELLRERAVNGVRYRFDVSVVLADTAARTVINRHDSVHVVLPRHLAGDHLLFTAIEVEAAPSTSTLKRVYMYNATAPGIGQLYSSPVIIPDYSGDDLMLSDIALAQPDVHGGWRRGDAALALLPTRDFPGRAFEVYYEVYNMPRGHAYRTDIAVAETGGARDRGDRPLVRLSFTGEAPATSDAILPELRRVETLLPRGHYRITVTVTDLRTGNAASRSRTFDVHGRRRATLVPALPVTSSAIRR